MKIHLKVWRQPSPTQPGQLVPYTADDVSPDMSFLEMLDVVNESLIAKGEDPIAFDSDCREGICGTCGFMVNGVAHGPDPGTTVCQLHMRRFKDGDTIILEPWRAKAFPLIKDLVVDRSAFDRIIQAGGYTSINVGGAPDANAILISTHTVEQAMDSAKISHLALLPQGKIERQTRVVSMVERHDAEGFGSCSNEGECEAVCPKGISITNIARMNREYFRAMLISRP